jgi:hypothetical protein
MPDFFGDAAADLSQYPPDTEAKMKYILDFFAERAKCGGYSGHDCETHARVYVFCQG